MSGGGGERENVVFVEYGKHTVCVRFEYREGVFSSRALNQYLYT